MAARRAKTLHALRLAMPLRSLRAVARALLDGESMVPSLLPRWLSRACAAALIAAPLAAGCSPPTDPNGPWRPREPEPIVVAFDGKVLGADGVPTEQRLAENVHLTVAPTVVTSGGETLVGVEVSVQLAPGWYMDERGLRFEQNSEVHVEGPFRREGGKIIVYATRVGRGTQVVQLRDEKGQPLWPAQGAGATGTSPAPDTSAAPGTSSSPWPIKPTPK